MTASREFIDQSIIHFIKRGDSPEYLADGLGIPVEDIYQLMAEHGLAFWSDELQCYCNPEPLHKKASTVGIPFVSVVVANPLGVRVAVLTNENDARSVALVVAAVVMFHF